MKACRSSVQRLAVLPMAVLLLVLFVPDRISALEPPVVPRPLRIETRDGRLEIARTLVVARGDVEARTVAIILAADLEKDGLGPFEVEDSDDGRAPGSLVIARDRAGSSLGAEGYTLEVDGTSAVLRATHRPGLFRGAQTVRQLISVIGETASLPCMTVEDRPRFSWRGMHLDVCRHFFPVDFVKRYIDLLAFHKMNVFHWHLTEDQGWRIEIDRYPKLTSVGAWRKAEGGGRYGGFYTKEEVREVVSYATERSILVVPEIEMPGHSLAALAAYPEISCTGGPFEVGTEWGVYEDVYCAGNEATFEFLTNVLDEVIPLFPGIFFHIGGDECPKARWKECDRCQKRIAEEGLADEHELQSWFVRRISKHLARNGKRLVGWDEILEGGLATGATVMSWRGVVGGIAAARQGHDVVMSPTSHCYFDYKQSDLEDEPGAFAIIDLRRVYSFEPVPEALTSEESTHILGTQGNVWTERIPGPARVEYMSVPRMSALAEVGWTAAERRDWDDFTRRLLPALQRLDGRDVAYRVPEPSGLARRTVFTDESMTIRLEPPLLGALVRFTLDGSEPTDQSPLSPGRIEIRGDTTLRVRTYLPSGRASLVRTALFERQAPRTAVDPGLVIPGLRLRTFAGSFESVPDVASLEESFRGALVRVQLPPRPPEGGYAMQLEGWVDVPEEGVWTFHLTSDDGSRLEIAGEIVIDNDGLHGARERSGQIALGRGLHPIRIHYFQAGGAESLSLEWQGPGQDRGEIPEARLFRKG